MQLARVSGDRRVFGSMGGRGAAKLLSGIQTLTKDAPMGSRARFCIARASLGPEGFRGGGPGCRLVRSIYGLRLVPGSAVA